MAFDFTGKTAIVTGGAGGIGSEIAKGIVEAHGGSISVKSDQVECTTFSVTIPIA